MTERINIEVEEDEIDEELYDIKHTVYFAKIAISAVLFTFIAIIFF